MGLFKKKNNKWQNGSLYLKKLFSKAVWIDWLRPLECGQGTLQVAKLGEGTSCLIWASVHNMQRGAVLLSWEVSCFCWDRLSGVRGDPAQKAPVPPSQPFAPCPWVPRQGTTRCPGWRCAARAISTFAFLQRAKLAWTSNVTYLLSHFHRWFR